MSDVDELNQVSEGGPADAQTPAEPGMIERAASALGLGGDTPADDPADPENAPIVTEEAAAISLEAAEDERKKQIKKDMAGNLGDKQAAKRETAGGRRDPRKQPDFEQHEEVATAEETGEE